MSENRLRWFDHVHRRPLDATVTRTDCLEVKCISRGRARFKKTWIETARTYRRHLI